MGRKAGLAIPYPAFSASVAHLFQSQSLWGLWTHCFSHVSSLVSLPAWNLTTDLSLKWLPSPGVANKGFRGTILFCLNVHSLLDSVDWRGTEAWGRWNLFPIVQKTEKNSFKRTPEFPQPLGGSRRGVFFVNYPNTFLEMWNIWAKIESWLHFLCQWPGRREHSLIRPRDEKSGTQPRMEIFAFQRNDAGRTSHEMPLSHAVCICSKHAFPAESHPSRPALPGCFLLCWFLRGLVLVQFCLENLTVQSFKVILQMCTSVLIYGSEGMGNLFTVKSIHEDKHLITADLLHVRLSTSTLQH